MAGTAAGADPATQPATTRAADTLPAASGPTTSRSHEPQLSSQESVHIRGFQFRGNTRFTDAQLQKVLAGYIDQRVTTAQLETARRAITQHYISAGYINSGAVLPDQTVSDGIIRFDIIEGRLSEVDVTFRDANGAGTSKHLLRPEYVSSRLMTAGQPAPMDLVRLKDELEILRQDKNIAAINAELRPGPAAGDSRLEVQVAETNPVQLGLQWSNRRNPSVGSTAYDILMSDTDVTGRGDRFAAQYDLANGSIADPQLSGANDFSVDYSIPFTPIDTTFAINFTRTDALVTQAPFTALDIRSRTDSTSLTIRQPVYRRPIADGAMPAMELDLFGAFALRDNATFLLGRPFSFTPGQQNGSGRATVLRFGQEFVARTEADALSARSVLSLGVPWFGSTSSSTEDQASGKFFAWIGQAQYVHLLGRSNWQIVARAAAQLSTRPLLPVEQFTIGGIDSVRGYPENFLVRDQGVTGTFELHIPIVRSKPGTSDVLTLVPFFDAGYGWNVSRVSSNEAADAVGIGAVFIPNRHITAQLYYGAALQNHVKSSQDPADLGIHFNFLFLAN